MSFNYFQYNSKNYFLSVNISQLFLVLFFFISSCNSNKLNVDVAGVTINNLVIARLDQDVFAIDTSNINLSITKLENKYGTFFNHFSSAIINNGGLHDSSFAFRIKQFVLDKDMKEAYNACQMAFPNTAEIATEFTDCFKHYKYYFPNKNIPKVVTMFSGFNYNAISIDSTIGLGLEMYLGEKNKFYKMLAFPQYKSRCMNRANILPDAVRCWMLTENKYMMNKNDFLSQIIYMGKIMYLSDALLPNVSDTLKTQYTRKQTEYCLQNEFNMWSYFIAQKTIYTTDQAEIMKFTSDGPFTTAFSKEAPPRVGYWMGRQIVKQFMEKNPEITFEQLLKENDAQNILTKAKYKPKK